MEASSTTDTAKGADPGQVQPPGPIILYHRGILDGLSPGGLVSCEKGAIARRRGVKDGRKGAPCTVFFVACRCRLLVCVASCKALPPFCPLHTHCNVVWLLL
jgi:hypothetical protein